MEKVKTFDPFLKGDGPDRIARICEAYGAHGMYSEEGENDGIGEGLPQRFDAAFNFLNAHRSADLPSEDIRRLAGRTNYFRETYAYGDDIRAPGIEDFLHNDDVIEAAREMSGKKIIVPAIIFSNMYVPGQSLSVHTDVPEFRGANRKVTPQWLLVAMKHSGLFEEWHMPILTCVSWYQDVDGGEFVYWPDGAEGEAVCHPAQHNTAALLDTDEIFHGVGRVKEVGGKIPVLKAGMKLTPLGDGEWAVFDGSKEIQRFNWEQMRLSLSWKCYCFEDEQEKAAWADHRDDLSVDFIVNRLVEELRTRGRIEGTLPEKQDLALMIIDEFVKFPPPHKAVTPEAFKAAS